MVNVIGRSVFTIPWFTFAILSCNKSAFKLVVRGFDFWIKTLYGMMFGLCLFYDNHRGVSTLEHINDCINVIGATLTVTFVASSDAVPPAFSRKWKIGWTTFIAIIYSLYSINYQFLAPAEKDHIIHIEITNSSFSFYSFLASSSRILAIFMWKQVINTYRKNGRCSAISYSPYIQWVDNKSNDNTKCKSSSKITANIDVDTEKHHQNEVQIQKIKKMINSSNEESISFQFNDYEESQRL